MLLSLQAECYTGPDHRVQDLMYRQDLPISWKATISSFADRSSAGPQLRNGRHQMKWFPHVGKILKEVTDNPKVKSRNYLQILELFDCGRGSAQQIMIAAGRTVIANRFQLRTDVLTQFLEEFSAIFSQSGNKESQRIEANTRARELYREKLTKAKQAKTNVNGAYPGRSKELEDRLAAAQQASGKSQDAILIEGLSLWWKQQETVLAEDPITPDAETAAASQGSNDNSRNSVRVIVDDPKILTEAVQPTLQRLLPDRSSPEEEIDEELENAKRGITAKIKQLCDSKAEYPPGIHELSANNFLGKKFSQALKEKLQIVFGNRACLIEGGADVEKSSLVREALRIFDDKIVPSIVCAPDEATVRNFEWLIGTRAQLTITKLLEGDLNYESMAKTRQSTGCGLLVVGGISMVSLTQMFRLVQHLPETFGLMLLGDVRHQSTVPDNVLDYLKQTGGIQTVRSN